MDIKFKQIDDKHIDILNEGKIIGKIFTPSGTGEVEPNAIQVCGFDEVFDYWGCGIFDDGKGHAKKIFSYGLIKILKKKVEGQEMFYLVIVVQDVFIQEKSVDVIMILKQIKGTETYLRREYQESQNERKY